MGIVYTRLVRKEWELTNASQKKNGNKFIRGLVKKKWGCIYSRTSQNNGNKYYMKTSQKKNGN